MITNLNDMKKRVLIVFLTVLILVSVLPLGINAIDGPNVNYSGKYAVYNIENSEYCVQKNIDEQNATAGTAKIMTAVIAFEYYSQRLDTPITVNGSWLSSVTGRTAKFMAGETIPAEKIISALVINSANDAAYILANAVSGSEAAFVEKMNDKARELGMNDTHYTNPAGTDEEGMYTTVRDVITLSAYAYTLPKLIEISDSPSVIIDATNLNYEKTLYNYNPFVSNYFNTKYLEYSVMGLNVGASGEGGRCLSIIGRSDAGLTYIVCVMGGVEIEELPADDPYFVGAFEDAKNLLEWAYDGFGYFTILDTSTMICEVPVKLSDKVDHVILLPNEKITVFLPLDTDINAAVEKKWELKSDTLKAPLSKGQVVGTLTVYVNGEQKGTVDLVAKNNVDRSIGLWIKDVAIEFISRPAVIIIAISILILAVVYVILRAKYTANKKRIVTYKKEK